MKRLVWQTISHQYQVCVQNYNNMFYFELQNAD